MKYYVYILFDPRKPGKFIYNSFCFLYKPFYIGKGKIKQWDFLLSIGGLKVYG